MIFKDMETLKKCFNEKTLVHFTQKIKDRSNPSFSESFHVPVYVEYMTEGTTVEQYYGEMYFCTEVYEIEQIRAMSKF